MTVPRRLMCWQLNLAYLSFLLSYNTIYKYIYIYIREYANRARINEARICVNRRLFSLSLLLQFFFSLLFIDIDRYCMMTMEASSNSRDGLSSTSLQLSVEQWELLRRLRNSHLTKTQIIRAYDELDRLDRELGNLFNTAPPSSSTIVPPPDPVSPSTMITQQISPSSSSISNNNKRPHSQTVNGLASRSSSTTSNGYHSHLHHHTTSPNLNVRPRNGFNNEIQSTNVNQYESMNSNDIEEETRELQELISYVFFI